ncbi:hypothetical protein BG015_005143 [Linnemannia schmuckeri]|uniref:F-box domain-containing protein n=1 Tax=Linnemannia schmuckeri TaxID=64567 RepID=A0A9P5VCH3_9FUNG|nr:hypothetical protein BG015_005143 [Linnemannia schmuckeri]
MSILNNDKRASTQQQEEQEQQQQQQQHTRIITINRPQNQTNNQDQGQDQDGSCNVQRALKMPEIVIEICHYLTVSELTACLSVCKLWNTVAQHHLWRSVFIYQKSEDFLVSLLPAQRELIRQNAQRIKTLGLVQHETVLVGCEACTQLEEVYFFGLLDKNQIPDRVLIAQGEEDEGESEVTQEEGKVDGGAGGETIEDRIDEPSALDLIAQNPRLQKIHLFDIEVLTRLWTPMRLRLLRQHPSLRSITMMFANYVYDLYIIRKLVAHCPDTVQELKITTFGGAILQSSVREEIIGDLTVNTWRSLPQMRDLTIEMCLFPCEETVLLPLLRCCPNLTRLRLNTMFVGDMDALMSVLMQESLRRSIIQLELPNTLSDPAFAVQFMEGYRGLTSLTMRVSVGYERVLAGMIQHLGSTLEYIRLVESAMTFSSQQYLAKVDSILEGCRRLKSLRVDVWENNTPGTGVSMNRLLGTAEWACKETLEELAVRIDNPRGDLDHWSYERGVMMVGKLFERLQGLPRLKKADFVWGGLWKAIPLATGLKGIRAASLRGSKMTMADVEWMGLHWE